MKKEHNLIVGIFDLTGCNGCLNILISQPEIVDIVDHLDIRSFRLASRGGLIDHYDVVLVEGTVVDEEEIDVLKRIRERSDVLVALGSCACFGGIETIRNFEDLENTKRYVYKDGSAYIRAVEVKPLESYVKVDYSIPGCPIDGKEAVEAIKALLVGKDPEILAYPVCFECKLRENECVLLKGIPCLGPITRAGCKARCPSNGQGCEGCRGPAKEINITSELELLTEIIKREDITLAFRKYAGLSEKFRKIAEGKIDEVVKEGT